MKINKAAQMLGRLGGKAGTGKAKARTHDQAVEAALARWNKPGARKMEVKSGSRDLKANYHVTGATAPSSAVIASSFEREFNDRAERWRKDTSFQSSPAAKFMHEDYQTIMAMGTPVIPLILERLKTQHEEWFWALKHLARGEDAAKQVDNPTDAAKAWLRWGRKKGYIE